MLRAALLIIVTLLILPSCQKSKTITFTEDDVAKVNNSINKIMNEMHVPGVVLYISVPAKGDLVMIKGVSDIKNNIPSGRNKLFRIGSITKTFTALTILQLVGANKLSLDDKLSKYESRIPNADSITIRMMLNHTCGIYSYTLDSNFVHAIIEDPLKKWTYEELISYSLNHPCSFQPGKGFGYSNTAYILLGRIIEIVTGNSATAEIRTRIIDKLGLKNTRMADGPDILGDFAHGYTYDLGGPELQDITRQELGSWGWTAGGLISDLDDMRICAREFATGSLLPPALKNEYLNWIPVPVSPGSPQDSFTGLGIVRYKDVIGNSGGTYGYTSWMWYIPSSKATLIAFFNETSTFNEEKEVREQQLLAEMFISVLSIMR